MCIGLGIRTGEYVYLSDKKVGALVVVTGLGWDIVFYEG